MELSNQLNSVKRKKPQTNHLPNKLKLFFQRAPSVSLPLRLVPCCFSESERAILPSFLSPLPLLMLLRVLLYFTYILLTYYYLLPYLLLLSAAISSFTLLLLPYSLSLSPSLSLDTSSITFLSAQLP